MSRIEPFYMIWRQRHSCYSSLLAMSIRSRQTFQQLVTLPDGAIPLAEAALLMACEEYPQLTIAPYLDQLDAIAAKVKDTMREGDAPMEIARKISAILFGELGFRGNTEDYYDPRNSFFNDVLERRIGIPITLSAVYMEIARRLPFPVSGVGMPGHFLVKYSDRTLEFFLDPYNGGEILSHQDCEEKLKQLYGDSLQFTEQLLDAVTHRQILARMLNNLKSIYLKGHTYDKGLAIVDMMMLVDPNDPEQYRDRGLLRLRLRQFEKAARDLEHYIKVAPGAADRADVEDHLNKLKRIQAMMN
jgi:regulator of sirC expression with transglutaminase-like and TPR domain